MSISRLGSCVALGVLLAAVGCGEEELIEVYYEHGPYEYALEPATWRGAGGEYVGSVHAGEPYEEPPTLEDVPADEPGPRRVDELGARERAEDAEFSDAAVVLVDPSSQWDPNNPFPQEPEPWEIAGFDRYEYAESEDTVDSAVILIEEYFALCGEIVLPEEKSPEQAKRPDAQSRGVVVVQPVQPVTGSAGLQPAVAFHHYYTWTSVPAWWAPRYYVGWGPIWTLPPGLGGSRLWPPDHSIGVRLGWIDGSFLGLPPSGWWSYGLGWPSPWVTGAHYIWPATYTSGTHLSVGFSYSSGSSFLWGGLVWHAGCVGHRHRYDHHEARYYRRRGHGDHHRDETGYARHGSRGRGAGRSTVKYMTRPAGRAASDRQTYGRSVRRARASLAKSDLRAMVRSATGPGPRPTAAPSSGAPKALRDTAAAPSRSPRSLSSELDRLIRARKARMEALRRASGLRSGASVGRPTASARTSARNAAAVGSPIRRPTTPTRSLVRPLEETPAPPKPKRITIRRHTGSGLIRYSPAPIQQPKASSSRLSVSRLATPSRRTVIPSRAWTTVRRMAPRPVARTNLPAPVTRTNLPAPVARTNLPAPVARTNLPAPVTVPRMSRTTHSPTTVKSMDRRAELAAKLAAMRARVHTARPVSRSRSTTELRRSTPPTRTITPSRTFRPPVRTVSTPTRTTAGSRTSSRSRASVPRRRSRTLPRRSTSLRRSTKTVETKTTK